MTDLLDTSDAGPAAIRGSAFRVAGFIVGTLVGLTSFAILARHLGVEDTGRYTVVVALVTVVGSLTDLGLTAIGTRELSTRTGSDRVHFARNLLGLRLVLSIVAGIGMIGLVELARYDQVIAAGVSLGAVGLLLASWQSTLSAELMSELRFGRVTVIDLTRAVLGGVLVLLLVAAGAGLLPFLAITIPVSIIALALNAYLLRGSGTLVPAFRTADWRVLFADALPYAVAAAVGAVYFQLAVIIVSLIAEPSEVGYFGVSARVVQVLLIIPGLAVGAAFPIFARAARDDRERLAYALARVFEVSLLVGVLVSLLLAVGAPIVIRLLGGPEFAGASPVLSIQAIGLAASFVGAGWSYGLLSLGRARDILKINLVALVLGGSAVAALASVKGAKGAALGASGAEVALAMLSGWALARADHTLTPPMRIVPAVVLATLLAIATVLIGLPVLLTCVLAAVVYLIVVVALRAVPPEIWQQFRRRST
ncbi:MAG: oligosaccharide flippase family protein [Gaiellales bacterium]